MIMRSGHIIGHTGCTQLCGGQVELSRWPEIVVFMPDRRHVYSPSKIPQGVPHVLRQVTQTFERAFDDTLCKAILFNLSIIKAFWTYP